MKEKELQKLFYKHNWHKYDLVATNMFLDSDYGEMDLMGIRKNGYVDEIEIKSSVKGYKHDFEKIVKLKRENETDNGFPLYDEMLKHDAIKNGVISCNYFSFLVPVDMIPIRDIPSYAGVYSYYTDDTGVCRIRQDRTPVLLHERKIPCHLKYEAAKKMATKFWRFKSDLQVY